MNKDKTIKLKRAREVAEQLFRDAAKHPEMGSMTLQEISKCLTSPVFQKTMEVLQRMSFSLLIPYFLGSSSLELLNEPTTEEQKIFKTKYGIRPEDVRIIQELVMGATFDDLRKKANVGRTKAQERLDYLCEVMGLENRKQLFFVFGWMRLIPLNLDCIRKSE